MSMPFGFVPFTVRIGAPVSTPNDDMEGSWRELALKHLPGFREVIQASTSWMDMWQNLKEFLADEGATEQGRGKAEAIFDYAWWCVTRSPDRLVASQVEVAFYEELPVYCDLECLVPLFISPRQFETLRKWFRRLLSDEEYEAFCARYYTEINRADGGDVV